jgi:glycosyltransferase involved in cell wall biosynthesis
LRAPLRVAVDARVVATDVRGIGRYERAVLRRLLERDDIAITLLLPEVFPSLRAPALARALGSSQFRVSRAVPRRTDVTWFPANGAFFDSHAPVVVTLHDAVPFRYPTADRKAREREQQPFLRSVRVARHIIAVSDFGKSEISTVFSVDPARITTIYHGIDDRFRPGAPAALPFGLREREYLLFVGDPAEPRKNFALLHQAYETAWPAGDGPPIVVAGADRVAASHSLAAGKLGNDLQNASDDPLVALYRGAMAVAVPSYHETFGFPLLEALACGTPALASDASSLREIAGAGARLLPPHEPAAWTAALRTISNDETERAQGVAHARAFTWQRSTMAHLDLLREVAAS